VSQEVNYTGTRIGSRNKNRVARRAISQVKQRKSGIQWWIEIVLLDDPNVVGGSFCISGDAGWPDTRVYNAAVSEKEIETLDNLSHHEFFNDSAFQP
jgi:hypothetical protein